jgi:hypothetical protein
MYNQYARKAWEIVGWTYDADVHCNACTQKRFSVYALSESFATDSEGNMVHPIFASDEYENEVCGDCHSNL